MSELTRAEAEALFERRRRAYLDEDTNAYLALWADEMVIELPGRQPIRGKDAYRKLVEQSFTHLRPVSFEFHRMAIDGDHMLAQWTIKAERKSDGHPVRWEGMSICQIRDGLIHYWREYWNPEDLRR